MQNDSGVQKAARNEMRKAERSETVNADKRRVRIDRRGGGRERNGEKLNTEKNRQRGKEKTYSTNTVFP